MMFIFSLISCSKQELMTYDETSLGSSIYFYDSIYSGLRVNQDISFGYVASDLMDSIVRIPIRVTGSPADLDRAVKVQSDSTTTMVQGVNYDFYVPPVIRAGLVTDTLKIKLYRTNELKDTTLHLGLVLTYNDNFNIDIPRNYTSSTAYASLLNYSINVNDIAGTSYLWTSTSYKSTVTAYFGTYSQEKVQLMMTVLGLSSSVFYDGSTSIAIALVIGWSSYMKAWLATEKAAGRIYYDSKGKEITMGSSAI